VLYSVLLVFLRPQIAASNPDLSRAAIENLVFTESLGWFPWYFFLTLAVLLIVSRWQLQNTDIYKRPG
jgi:hypothetical protein